MINSQKGLSEDVLSQNDNSIISEKDSAFEDQSPNMNSKRLLLIQDTNTDLLLPIQIKKHNNDDQNYTQGTKAGTLTNRKQKLITKNSIQNDEILQQPANAQALQVKFKRMQTLNNRNDLKHQLLKQKTMNKSPSNKSNMKWTQLDSDKQSDCIQKKFQKFLFFGAEGFSQHKQNKYAQAQRNEMNSSVDLSSNNFDQLSLRIKKKNILDSETKIKQRNFSILSGVNKIQENDDPEDDEIFAQSKAYENSYNKLKLKQNQRSLTLNPNRKYNYIQENKAILADSTSILSSLKNAKGLQAAKELLNELNGLNFQRLRNRKLTKAEIVAVYSKNSYKLPKQLKQEQQEGSGNESIEELSPMKSNRKFYRAEQNLKIHTNYNSKKKGIFQKKISIQNSQLSKNAHFSDNKLENHIINPFQKVMKINLQNINKIQPLDSRNQSREVTNQTQDKSTKTKEIYDNKQKSKFVYGQHSQSSIKHLLEDEENSKKTQTKDFQKIIIKVSNTFDKEQQAAGQFIQRNSININEIDSIFILNANDYSQQNNLRLLVKAMKTKQSISISSGERGTISPEFDYDHFHALSQQKLKYLQKEFKVLFYDELNLQFDRRLKIVTQQVAHLKKQKQLCNIYGQSLITSPIADAEYFQPTLSLISNKNKQTNEDEEINELKQINKKQKYQELSQKIKARNKLNSLNEQQLLNLRLKEKDKKNREKGQSDQFDSYINMTSDTLFQSLCNSTKIQEDDTEIKNQNTKNAQINQFKYLLRDIIDSTQLFGYSNQQKKSLKTKFQFLSNIEAELLKLLNQKKKQFQDLEQKGFENISVKLVNLQNEDQDFHISKQIESYTKRDFNNQSSLVRQDQNDTQKQIQSIQIFEQSLQLLNNLITSNRSITLEQKKQFEKTQREVKNQVQTLAHTDYTFILSEKNTNFTQKPLSESKVDKGIKNILRNSICSSNRDQQKEINKKEDQKRSINSSKYLIQEDEGEACLVLGVDINQQTNYQRLLATSQVLKEQTGSPISSYNESLKIRTRKKFQSHISQQNNFIQKNKKNLIPTQPQNLQLSLEQTEIFKPKKVISPVKFEDSSQIIQKNTFKNQNMLYFLNEDEKKEFTNFKKEEPNSWRAYQFIKSGQQILQSQDFKINQITSHRYNTGKHFLINQVNKTYGSSDHLNNQLETKSPRQNMPQDFGQVQIKKISHLNKNLQASYNFDGDNIQQNFEKKKVLNNTLKPPSRLISTSLNQTTFIGQAFNSQRQSEASSSIVQKLAQQRSAVAQNVVSSQYGQPSRITQNQQSMILQNVLNQQRELNKNMYNSLIIQSPQNLPQIKKNLRKQNEQPATNSLTNIDRDSKRLLKTIAEGQIILTNNNQEKQLKFMKSLDHQNKIKSGQDNSYSEKQILKSNYD